jgi:hypothetical protein
MTAEGEPDNTEGKDNAAHAEALADRLSEEAGGWSAPEPVTDAATLRAALAVALATVEPIPPLALAVRVTVEVPMAAIHTLLVSALEEPRP